MWPQLWHWVVVGTGGTWKGTERKTTGGQENVSLPYVMQRKASGKVVSWENFGDRKYT